MTNRHKITTSHRPTNSRCAVVAILILSILSACTGGAIYDSHHNIPHTGWEAYDTLTFTIDAPQKGLYDIDLFLRHDNSYKYSNIWLFISHTTPQEKTTTDTLDIVLADTYGNWYGGGWGSYYQYQQPLHTALPLDSGTHTIGITQAMRELTLQGIATIGLRVTPHKP